MFFVGEILHLAVGYAVCLKKGQNQLECAARGVARFLNGVGQYVVVQAYVCEEFVSVWNKVLCQFEGVVVFGYGSFAVADENAGQTLRLNRSM